MSDTSQGEGWWQASDGKWYPATAGSPGEGWWIAADGKWYPPANAAPGEGWWLAADGKWYPPNGTGTTPAAGSAPPAPARPVATRAVPPKAVPRTAVPAKAVPMPRTAPAAQTPAGVSRNARGQTAGSQTAGSQGAGGQTAGSQGAPPKQPHQKAPRTIAAASAESAPVTADLNPIGTRNQQSQADAKMLAAKRMAAATRALASLGSLDPDLAPPREMRETRAVRTATKAPVAPAAQVVSASPPAAPAKAAPAPSTTKAKTAPAASPAPAVKVGRPAQGPPPVPLAQANERGVALARLVTTPVPDRPSVDRPPPAHAPPITEPSVIAPATRRDPAVAAASAALAVADAAPLLEVKPKSLNQDVDRIGDRLVVFKDRVELHDRAGTVRQSIRGDQITDVVVQKKFTGSAVTVESIDGTMIVAKGLRPEQAEEVRDLILRRTRRGDGPNRARQTDAARPASAAPSLTTPTAAPTTQSPTPATPSSADQVSGRAKTERPAIDANALLAKLDDLHEAGVLTTNELDEKRALVARLASGNPYVSTPS